MGCAKRYIHHNISTAQIFKIVIKLSLQERECQTWFIFLLIEILSLSLYLFIFAKTWQWLPGYINYFSLNLQQRVKSASSAEHMKVLAVECSNADTQFQQLDKLRMIYEEYVKLGKESIPLAKRNIDELTEDLNQKSQEFDDVFFFSYFVLIYPGARFQLSMYRTNNGSLQF